ncbi:hypothetical protein [Sphingomonas sp. 37zxx]|uniref:hypothetical protein n=1 Tax=Sphingomonas sp. 37zxx TaxID=1550073 RepID=UPI00053BF7CE|nr:hypothetical protein [Sphingomonas sp. 37zxx]
MKTPYDAALQLRQREIDTIKVSISVEHTHMRELSMHRDAIDTTVRDETALASQHHQFPSDTFVARMRTKRAALSREYEARDQRLDLLRIQAAEAYGSLSAIGAAADRHRAEALRVIAIAEQDQIDDFSAARFTRTLSAARRLRAARTDKP